MSDLDFDLNAPAAPSLTLDAALPPHLTLDPEADAKVVEEAKRLPRYRGGYPAEPRRAEDGAGFC